MLLRLSIGSMKLIGIQLMSDEALSKALFRALLALRITLGLFLRHWDRGLLG